MNQVPKVRIPKNRLIRDHRTVYPLSRSFFGLARDERTSNLSKHIHTIKFKNSKNFESLHIIWVLKSEKTFKMSFWADFGRESEKTLTVE